jgi:hypothetical protein
VHAVERMVERMRIELTTSALRTQRSPKLSYRPIDCYFNQNRDPAPVLQLIQRNLAWMAQACWFNTTGLTL